MAATAAQAGTPWICGLSDDLVRLVCVADLTPESLDAPAASGPAATVRGTSFPLNPRLRYEVDLWTPPSDPEFVTALAEATICYRSPGCTVIMRLPPEIGGAPGSLPTKQTAQRR